MKSQPKFFRRILAIPAIGAAVRHFDVVLGFVIIVAFQLLGMTLHRLGAPLPGGVLGLLLFTFALAIELVKVQWVERTASFLVRHMTLLFIPMMVALPHMSAELRKDSVALLISVITSLLSSII